MPICAIQRERCGHRINRFRATVPGRPTMPELEAKLLHIELFSHPLSSRDVCATTGPENDVSLVRLPSMRQRGGWQPLGPTSKHTEDLFRVRTEMSSMNRGGACHSCGAKSDKYIVASAHSVASIFEYISICACV
jgi:hypothetical protein